MSTTTLSWVLSSYLGVALTFPVLSAAAVSGLPVEKFGVGGAINQTSRQLGAVLGVALLVAIIGTPSSADAALHAFRNASILCGVASLTCAVLALGHVRPETTVAPAQVHAFAVDA